MFAKILFLVLICNSSCFVHRNQSFEISGRFMCAGEPVHNAAVELWEDNRPLWKIIWHSYLKIQGKSGVHFLCVFE